MNKTKIEPNTKVRTIFLGRRKTAICRLRAVKDKEGIFVNKRPLDDYFNNLIIFTKRIHDFVELFSQFLNQGFICNVQGGGLSAQSESIIYGLAKYVKSKIVSEVDLKTPEGAALNIKLRSTGFLTYDPRQVQPKKYGHKKARKKKQSSKR